MVSVHFCYKLSFHYPCVLRLKFFIFKIMEHQILHAWKINERKKMWFKWWVLNLGKIMELSKIVLDNHVHNGTRMFKSFCLMILYCSPFVDNNGIWLWFNASFQHLLANHRKHFDLEEIMNKNGGIMSLFCHFPFIHYVLLWGGELKLKMSMERRKKHKKIWNTIWRVTTIFNLKNVTKKIDMHAQDREMMWSYWLGWRHN